MDKEFSATRAFEIIKAIEYNLYNSEAITVLSVGARMDNIATAWEELRPYLGSLVFNASVERVSQKADAIINKNKEVSCTEMFGDDPDVHPEYLFDEKKYEEFKKSAGEYTLEHPMPPHGYDKEGRQY